MKRSSRFEPVRQVVDDTQRRQAGQLAASEQRLGDCERKLAELEQFQNDYRQKLTARSSNGIGVAGLRDYQVFLARLSDAIQQQTQLVAAARNDCERERARWQDAARRSKAIEHVVDQWRTEERLAVDKREQHDSDERAQRAAYVKDQ
jgi:flagellar FliJ protein